MADSLRITEPTGPAVLTGGVGEFGQRVAGFLSDWLPQGAEYKVGDGLGAAFCAASSAVVLALWRPEPDLCEQADELAFQHQIAWLPVIMEHPVVRIGPLVDPATGPCFRCYSRRRAQHDRQPWITVTLHASYRRDQDWGPAGYLPHQARMASAVALRALAGHTLAPASRCEDRATGEVATIGLVAGGLSVSPVIACHNCDRCTPAKVGAAQPFARLDWIRRLATGASR
ncbi:MAG TPA: TOMM precursor leader peptide-binding protein [Streptosporangiaceae bacterium]|jgi:bacteriocin biosynthesis cyclodehydratase domain-containing protein|nr:TOMM precursor leader peptide-binding protein [Streptosporangiaceae bacterium]